MLIMISTAVSAQDNFKNNQMKKERVSAAYAEKWDGLGKELKSAGINGNYALFITAYKNEGKLELWLKTPSQPHAKLFKTYDFCKHSGTLGPKVVEGDGQTPEGLYKINAFNPESSFHLSLGIDYPNQVDLVRTGKGRKPGNDIYIHGNCVTVGCIPLTDEKIKEVYVLAVEAKNNGQKEIPVYIFPFKMTDSNLKKYSKDFPQELKFWQSLQIGYQVLQKTKNQLELSQSQGAYIIFPPAIRHDHTAQ
jgi:murein L,D-transpeptidase YafK